MMLSSWYLRIILNIIVSIYTKNIKDLHECYVNQIKDVDNVLSMKKMSAEMSTALKVHNNQTSRNVVKINRFQNMNSKGEGIASAEEICKFEDDMGVNNVTYKLVLILILEELSPQKGHKPRELVSRLFCCFTLSLCYDTNISMLSHF